MDEIYYCGMTPGIRPLCDVGHEGRRREDVALSPWVGHLGIEGGGDDKHKDHDDDDEVDWREDLLQTNAMLSN